MASSGDPSTFTFTMDAFPGYTMFEPNKKVLCVMQVIDEKVDAAADKKSVMKHADSEESYIEESKADSTQPTGKAIGG